MSLELNIELTEENQVIVHFDRQQSMPFDFKMPLNDEVRMEINWYLEYHATSSDIERKQACSAQLPQIGERLFQAVFSDEKALELFRQFKSQEEKGRLLIIRAPQSAILSLPWELLSDPEATYFCHDTFPIAIRRTHFTMVRVVRKPLVRKLLTKESPHLQNVGFFGRSEELWQIERAFVQDGIRRFTISGVGGQGKTSLAIEAAQWLYRIGVIEKICFVDYAAFVGVDAIGLALRTLTEVLGKPLNDENAISEALQDSPTLLILDNVERIPVESLRELLDAAVKWSDIGECRILLTRQTADDELTENNLHQSLVLSGLDEENALAYCLHWLVLLPTSQVEMPKREALLGLFQKVAFNPLLIRILSMSLNRNTTELGERLEVLLAETPVPLWATLNLYLEGWEVENKINPLFVWLARLVKFQIPDKLSLELETLHFFLPILGVFQGGAFEPEILTVTKFPKKQWKLLLSALQQVGLIQAEDLPDFIIPYLKFHPTLAQTLWARLSLEEQERIHGIYQWRYVELISYLFFEEGKNTVLIHALAKQDLFNILHSIYTAIDANEKWVPKVANYIDLFLNVFGLKRESVAMNQRLENAGYKKSGANGE